MSLGPNDFKIDPLLLNEKDRKNFVNINKLVDTPFPCFLCKDTLNLYTALVKSKDFDRTLNSMVFCKISTEILCHYLNKKLIEKDFLGLRKKIAEYCNRKKIKVECIRRWSKNNAWPFVVLRIISLIQKDDLSCLSELMDNVEYFADVHERIKFYPPKKLNDILNKRYAYLSGCILGDGGFCPTHFLTIVDGSSKEEEINDSIVYLKKIKRLIEKLFRLKLAVPSRRDNKIELIVKGKSFCRFINFYFGLPYGKKKEKIEKPKIFSLSNKSNLLYKLFWRGVFDTDGHCQLENKQISVCSGTKFFIDECKEDLDKIDLNTGKPSFTKSGSYSLLIPSKSYKDFSYKIGFSHPRKMRNMIKNLKEGPNFKICKGLLNGNLYNSHYFDLRKIDGLRVYNAGNYIYNMRKELNLDQKELAHILNVRRKVLSSWETDRKGVPFLKFYKIANLKGINYDQFICDIYGKVGFGVNRGRRPINLPVKASKEIIKLASCVSPYKNELRIRKINNDNKKLDEIEDSIKILFDLKVVEIRKNVHSVLNNTLSSLFETYFLYEKPWNPITDKEARGLHKSLNSIWN